MANKTLDINTILDEIEEDFKKSLDAQVAGMPDSLDDAIDAAQTSRKLGLQKTVTTNTTGNFIWNGTVPPITDTNAYNERQQWLKETEHNRLIALTEANRLATEVFKSTVTPGGLVETTEQILLSAKMMANFLNEGKVQLP